MSMAYWTLHLTWVGHLSYQGALGFQQNYGRYYLHQLIHDLKAYFQGLFLRQLIQIK